MFWKQIVVMVAQLSDCAKCHRIIPFKIVQMVNLICFIAQFF